jgi:hypothetical protein
VSWQQVRTALATYRELHPDTPEVPAVFTVPELEPWPESVRGLPLGRYLPILVEKILPKNDKARDAFAELGIEPEKPPSADDDDDKLMANDVRFQKVFAALKTYQTEYGDLLVPQPFVVPDSDAAWPEETWGLRLGARVNAIRSQGTFVNNNPERRDVLDDLGFVWSPPKSSRRRGRRSKADADADAAIDSLLDGSFDFSSDRTTTQDSSFFDDDEDTESDSDVVSLDIATDPTTSVTTSPSWNLEGAHMPDKSATAMTGEDPAVAATEEYTPSRTLEQTLKEAGERALACGVIEGLTPTKRVIKGKREKDIPWFNDDFGDDFVFEDVVEALAIYKSMYDDWSNLTMANSEFAVPVPKEVTGFLNDDDGTLDSFDVGASARAAAAIASFEEQELRADDLIAAEIRKMQEEVDGEAAVALKRMTATEASTTTTWPEHLAGMQLGGIVRRIRDGSLEVKHLPERKEQLDALDFEWGDAKYFIDSTVRKGHMCHVCLLFDSR